MNQQFITCIVIFILTLGSYMLNKIPMWVTSLLSLAALYFTGCIDASQALAGFSNSNTLLMGALFMVAAGFRRTSLVDKMCDWLMKMTKGSTKMVYLGYLLMAVLLTNFISSPMVVYAIVSPLLMAFCDKVGIKRSKVVFPLMVICVSCSGILPLPSAIQKAGEFNGYLEIYGFQGITFDPMYFLIGRWPLLIVAVLWALFIGPKFCPDYEVVNELSVKSDQKTEPVLSPFTDKAGIIIFVVTMLALIFSSYIGLATWFIALTGALLMALFKVVDQKKALSEIPWEMLMLFVGALALGEGLNNTGAGQAIGELLANAVGGTHNNYILGTVFFVVPFILTQFMLNRSVSAVFVPICLLTCQVLGANPIGLIMLVHAGSLTAFLTPMATPAVAMCMEDGSYQLKDLLKAGWLVSILFAVVYILYTSTVYPAF